MSCGQCFGKGPQFVCEFCQTERWRHNMKEKRWVQHISGQGEKWELDGDGEIDGYAWGVEKEVNGKRQTYFLPKSEYRLCDPPEVWNDIGTRYVEMVYVHDHQGNREDGVFRVKVEHVEKKVSE